VHGGPLWFRAGGTEPFPAPSAGSEKVEVMNEYFDNIAAYLKDKSRLSFSGHKRTVLRHRLEARLEQLQLPGFAEYWELLRCDPGEEEQLFELATTNETSFFRNQGQFAYLKESIIPALESRLSQGGGTIRILSAGCSTGEEPYSIAMTALTLSASPGASVWRLWPVISARIVSGLPGPAGMKPGNSNPFPLRIRSGS